MRQINDLCQFANQFARYLLMPANQFKKVYKHYSRKFPESPEFVILECSDYFGVPPEEVRKCIEERGLDK